MKKSRLELIKKLIESNEIATQEELLAALKEHGLSVTQATVSRDIKELGLSKTMGKSGRYRYSNEFSPATEIMDKFHAIFAQSVIRVDHAMNTVVIKCYPGMAQGACAAVDAMEWQNVVGTLAGDDTIFALCRDDVSAIEIEDAINQLLK